MTEYAVAPVPVANAGRKSLVRRLVRNPVAVVAIAYLALVAVIAVIGRLISPYDPKTASLQLVLATPSAEHPLGADSAGSDVLSRLLTATQISVAAALVALVVALLIGVIGGLLAGYYLSLIHI